MAFVDESFNGFFDLMHVANDLGRHEKIEDLHKKTDVEDKMQALNEKEIVSVEKIRCCCCH